MKKTAIILCVSMLLLVACQGNPSSFSPDVSTTIRPQSSDSVNVVDEDIRVAVRNNGDINAYDVTVDVEVNGEEIQEKTLGQLASSEEEIIRYEKGGELTDHCEGDQTTLKVSASPSVKDLDPANNAASQSLTC